MKKENGITMISITVYIIAMVIVVGIIATVTSFFYSNVNLLEEEGKNATEFSKFNNAFLDDTKTSGNMVKTITESSVEFESGTKYIYKNGGIYRDSVKICNNVEKAIFKMKYEYDKAIVNVDMVIGKENKYSQVVDYILTPKEVDTGIGTTDNIKRVEPNPPILMEGMTAVYWDNNGNEIKQGDSNYKESDWYDYYDQRWANATTKDGSYFVWIPRYEYLIVTPYTSVASEIKINFIKTEITTATNGYKIHPAFSTDINNGGWSKNISGIWVAKYAAGFQRCTTNTSGTVINGSDTVLYSDKKYTSSFENTPMNALLQSLTKTTYASQNISYPIFKPLTYAYNVISAGDAYTITQEIDGKDINGSIITKAKNFYGLNPDKTDSHMLKNSEWGAIVYFAQSKYGRNKQPIGYNGKNLLNSSRSIYGVTGYESTTPLGVGASTTNNITGIFDLSGCVEEFTAGYILNPVGASARNEYVQSFATKTTSTRYATIYPYSSSDTDINNWNTYNSYKSTRYGDAILETSLIGSKMWHSNYLTSFPRSGEPVFVRGGSYQSALGAFSFSPDIGDPYSHGFRTILIDV